MRLLAVTIEVELSLATLVKLEVGVPIKRAAIVLHIGQRFVAVVGLIEILGSRKTGQHIVAVARSPAGRTDLVNEVKVNFNLRNVLTIKERIALATGTVVGLYIDFSQILQQIVLFFLTR